MRFSVKRMAGTQYQGMLELMINTAEQWCPFRMDSQGELDCCILVDLIPVGLAKTGTYRTYSDNKLCPGLPQQLHRLEVWAHFWNRCSNPLTKGALPTLQLTDLKHTLPTGQGRSPLRLLSMHRLPVFCMMTALIPLYSLEP